MAMTGFSNSARFYGTTVHTASSGSSYNWSRLHAAAIDRSVIDRAAARDEPPAEKALKRVFDILLALLLIGLLSPVLLTIAGAAAWEGGEIFFGHRRIGTRGHSFNCWKFRTMVKDADRVLARVLADDPEARAEWKENFKLKNDPRVTRIGRLLRVTSLDELPQLFNVITGEMSMVGPRPIVAEEISRYGAAFHDYTSCRPGITGIWQISGRNDVDYGTRVRLDQQYARQWSLGSDVKLLLKTPFAVLKRSGAY